MPNVTLRFNCLLCPEGFETNSTDNYYLHHRMFHAVDLHTDCAQRVITAVGEGEISIEFFEFQRRRDNRTVGTLRREKGVRRDVVRA